VGEAFARLAHVVDEIGLAVVPADVRALVTARLARWNGERLGLGQGWAMNAVGTLDAPDRPLAVLLLLTALASHQVDESIVAAARTGFDDDGAWSRNLVGAVAWAAFSAARTVGTRLQSCAEISMPFPVARRY